MKRAGLLLSIIALVSLAAAAPAERARVVAAGAQNLTVLVDHDDDDADGIADLAQPAVSAAAQAALLRLTTQKPLRLQAYDGDAVALVVGGKARTPDQVKGQALTRFALRGLRPGAARLDFGDSQLNVAVLSVFPIDEAGRRVDMATSHASISRSLPASLAGPTAVPDQDMVRWLVAGPATSLPDALELSSTRGDGSALDSLGEVPLVPRPCPADTPAGLVCRATPPIRATGDTIDRSHPESAARSLRAEVGGRVTATVPDAGAVQLRVGGPRTSRVGPIGRLRAKLRLRLVRLSAGGSPPIGGDDAGALAQAKEEVAIATGLWGQCGIHFGAAADLDVAIVDPPPPSMLAVGCDLAVPATGGGRVHVSAGSKTVTVSTQPGQTPMQVAAALAEELRRQGLSATLSPNARISPAALRSVDVLVRARDGKPVTLSAAEGGVSSDATLDVCLGDVDLADGLTHFTDFDASAGTVEERSLIKAFDDGDPTTIEIFVIPTFARTGRIGESFIYADGGSIRNVVVIDRAGIRAGARSFALAHELGHILLDMPGHPDDFGVDRPSALMDADAADATIFGPRRLSVAECERAILQNGPRAPVPLLTPWPLFQPATMR